MFDTLLSNGLLNIAVSFVISGVCLVLLRRFVKSSKLKKIGTTVACVAFLCDVVIGLMAL